MIGRPSLMKGKGGAPGEKRGENADQDKLEGTTYISAIFRLKRRIIPYISSGSEGEKFKKKEEGGYQRVLLSPHDGNLRKGMTAPDTWSAAITFIIFLKFGVLRTLIKHGMTAGQKKRCGQT